MAVSFTLSVEKLARARVTYRIYYRKNYRIDI